MIKALIVDDERLAREELKHLLKSSDFASHIQVKQEATNAESAQQLIESEYFDLIFLDIQMPGRNGFELLDDLSVCPDIIFTTAYDEYALEAFNNNAIDYLLKPVEPKRLNQAISKLSLPLNDKLIEKQKKTSQEKFFIKDGDKCWFIKLSEVICFSSMGNYCHVILKTEQPLIRKTLQQLESILAGTDFFRINRQHVINIRAIDNITIAVSGNLQVLLNNNTMLEMSRRQSQIFKDRMGL